MVARLGRRDFLLSPHDVCLLDCLYVCYTMGLQVFYPPPLKLWTKLWIVHKITFYVKLWITVLRKINLWTIHNLWKIHKMHLEENCGQFVNCGSPSDFKKNCGQSTNFVDSSPQKIVDNPQILWTSMQFQAENPPQIPEIFACGAKKCLRNCIFRGKNSNFFRACGGLCM